MRQLNNSKPHSHGRSRSTHQFVKEKSMRSSYDDNAYAAVHSLFVSKMHPSASSAGKSRAERVKDNRDVSNLWPGDKYFVHGECPL
jgi:hypothetical protein